jgi:dolichyl-phosphate-mannose-protein mannosyltransferase
MIPRVLSIAGPVLVYVTLAILVTGLWRERRKLEWLALAPAAAGLLASFIFLSPIHRLFFDEDAYISIAQNLTRAPVERITLLGGPRDVEVSSYYKEPPGWPVILSLIFLITGRSEAAAYIAARLFFAIAIAAVYHLGREMFDKRRALVAAILFGAAPACFWFSPSAGTDIPAVLAAALGMWGILAGNGMLAAGGFALAAQIRLELIVLVPMVWLSRKVSLGWTWIAAALIGAEVVHIGWVMSIAPALAAMEKVRSAFGFEFVASNLITNVKYILNPLVFPAGITVMAVFALATLTRRFAPPSPSGRGTFFRSVPLPLGEGGAKRRVRVEFTTSLHLLQILLLFGIYAAFYAGSFEINPRYTIQFFVPLALMAASIANRPLAAGVLLLTTAIPYVQPLELPTYVQALAADHRTSTEFADRFGPDDLIVSTEPEMFLNYGKRAMNAVYASQHKEELDEQIRRRKVIYHSGVRTNRPDTEEWRADQWVKSNFELHLIDSREIRGLRIAFYQMLLKDFDREAR